MSKPIRAISILLLVAFSASLGTYRWSEVSARQEVGTMTGLLPVAFAIPVDVAFEDTLRAGETLSQLLLRAQLAESDARMLLALLSEHQDPRRMKAGSIINLRRSVDSGDVRRMEFHLDADRVLNILRSGETWTGDIEEVPVRADTVVITGTIESSLYRALMRSEDTNMPTADRERLADQLADRIFAWKIDFSRDLRRGDTFRVLYERLVRPDGTARSGRVISAQLSINNRDYEAHAFVLADGTEDYFDRAGESLRGAFLRAPLQYRRISSAFSTGRFHPILQVTRPHNGIDYAAAAGTPVFAVGDGVIRLASNAGDLGNLVEITHSRGYLTRYAHLRGFAPGIRAGVHVKQGDVIGYVGSTGLATGPHLHFEFHANGRPINPNSIQDTNGDPVPGGQLARFQETVQLNAERMDRLSGRILLADATAGVRAAGD